MEMKHWSDYIGLAEWRSEDKKGNRMKTVHGWHERDILQGGIILARSGVQCGETELIYISNDVVFDKPRVGHPTPRT